MLQSLTGEARGILPTFTSGADVDAHREAVNAQHQALNAQIVASSVSPTFKQAWDQYLASWVAFYDANKAASTVSKFLSAKSMYEQIDQFAAQIPTWAQQFQAAGGTVTGPLPSLADAPSSLTAGNVTGLVVAAGAVAAIVIFGPSIAKGLNHG